MGRKSGSNSGGGGHRGKKRHGGSTKPFRVVRNGLPAFEGRAKPEQEFPGRAPSMHRGNTKLQTESHLPWDKVVRLPLDADRTRINDFLKRTGGGRKSLGHHLTHDIVVPNDAKLIFTNYGDETANTILEGFLSQHDNEVEYEILRIFSKTGNKPGRIFLGAIPTPDTCTALNNDISDFLDLFQIEKDYRHRRILLGTYTTQQACNIALDTLNAELIDQGGVLLTYGAAQLPPK